ncbi:hypothetical protein GCM10017687_24580 [Streptomyces echinatus]
MSFLDRDASVRFFSAPGRSRANCIDTCHAQPRTTTAPSPPPTPEPTSQPSEVRVIATPRPSTASGSPPSRVPRKQVNYEGGGSARVARRARTHETSSDKSFLDVVPWESSSVSPKEHLTMPTSSLRKNY